MAVLKEPVLVFTLLFFFPQSITDTQKRLQDTETLAGWAQTSNAYFNIDKVTVHMNEPGE